MTRNIHDYIAGYVDGEGSFAVSIQWNESCRVGFQLLPEFHVSQNGDRAEVLDERRRSFPACALARAVR
jgi:hypothetical protein